ncbi:MAG: hypothetical protein JNM07_13575 [Phycisphaerae bacterium]|nr:hypothetical protein [Phycisphaerae bacterium]
MARRTTRVAAGRTKSVGGNPGSASQPREGRLPKEIADAVEAVIEQLLNSRQRGQERVEVTLSEFKTAVMPSIAKMPRMLPSRLAGRLVNPDGTPAAGVAVRAVSAGDASPLPGGGAGPVRTRPDGSFVLHLPWAAIPDAGIKLLATGGGAKSEIAVPRGELRASQGRIGTVESRVSFTSASLVGGALAGALPGSSPAELGAVPDDPEHTHEPPPPLCVGEDDCQKQFGWYGATFEKHRWGIVFRLVEPEVVPKTPIVVLPLPNGKEFKLPKGWSVPAWMQDLQDQAKNTAKADLINFLGAKIKRRGYTSRIPVDEPIDVVGFQERAAADPMGIPRAGTLALGYVLSMRQEWILSRLSLGDLLYSLPLAPGEQQRIAVIERSESAQVRDSASEAAAESQSFSEAADQSTLATFRSSAMDVAVGGTLQGTYGAAGGAGVAGGIGGFYYALMGAGAAMGVGVAESLGASVSGQVNTRDYASKASEDFHSALERRARGSRSASRTAVRLASADERQTITTKVIVNHNRCHALTMQYWEVLRDYIVTTHAEDAQLVVFVPMELVRWLPEGQPRTLSAIAYTRDDLLARYDLLIRYFDTLTAAFPPSASLRHGLRSARDLASNPAMTVETLAPGGQQRVLVIANGTFFTFEDVYATVVTKTGRRFGPVLMAGQSIPDPILKEIGSRAIVLTQLRMAREDASQLKRRTASIVIDESVAYSDIARIEVSRRFRDWRYTLKNLMPTNVTMNFMESVGIPDLLEVSFSGGELERELGGPLLKGLDASVGLESIASDLTASPDRMGSVWPMVASGIPPMLRAGDVLRIEAAFQHVLSNAVLYSRAVWAALGPEERAILLERYTIGIPKGGSDDAEQQVPLLNCVANQVLGFYGNSMLMPFHIPPRLADDDFNTATVQDAILSFHRTTFRPPRSIVSLPTRGMLGEAVLGCCNSAEKIDITRFWNWKDSPIEDAVAEPAAPPGFERKSLLDKIAAAVGDGPAAGTGATGQSIINIGTGPNAPAPKPAVLENMLSKIPAASPITDITGAQWLSTVLGKTVDAASSSATTAMTQAGTVASSAMNNLDKVMTAAKAADDASAKAAADAKDAEAKKVKEAADADQKKAQEAADALTKTITDGMAKLKESIASYIGVVGSRPDDASALAAANEIMKGLFGETKPKLSDAAGLFSLLAPATGDQPPAVVGKSALRKALGL